MNVQVSEPFWLVAMGAGIIWVFWLSRSSHAGLEVWRNRISTGLRILILVCVCCALGGLEWQNRTDGMNVFFLLDRSESISDQQLNSAKDWIQKVVDTKESKDKAGVVLFGSHASVEQMPNSILKLQNLFTVVDRERTDIAAALRLAAAAFPESGQRRIVILSDGNENLGNAIGAVESIQTLGVSVDVVPLEEMRAGDISIQKFSSPTKVKRGQAFESKVFVDSDRDTTAILKLYRNDQLLGSQGINLNSGKNLFVFPQKLDEPAFYKYDVRLEIANDLYPQNNKAVSFTNVEGEPRVLFVTTTPEEDQFLIRALQSSGIQLRIVGVKEFPTDLAEIQSYDSVVLSNIAAGDLGNTLMRYIERLVRDFGLGLVCIGGDQSFTAGAYRGTPLEEALPVDMELSSKKILPRGALVLVMHGMEFANGNQVARQTALGVLDALGPNDELGVVLWDGTERWLFPLRPVGDKSEMGRTLAGMNQGDLPSFSQVLKMAHTGLKASTAGLKHVIVFSDGDPGPPTNQQLSAMVDDRITVSSVLIAGHSTPDTMIDMASRGRGRFYDVRNPAQIPQIFIKETSVVLKSAIYEEPFLPKWNSPSEVLNGIGQSEYPLLQGYVATTLKPRAESPLLTTQGDPLLAHWQHGLGRVVAFTSDAKSRWASDWTQWSRFRQFWSQLALWSLRRLENNTLDAHVVVEQGEGIIGVEAVDSEGNYRNFLELKAVVSNPSGERTELLLTQVASGRYEARFATKEVGGYLVNLSEIENGEAKSTQVIGASVNHSPEFSASRPNRSLLNRLAQLGSGKELQLTNSTISPFLHDRKPTLQPIELWEFLLKLAIILFPVDVGVRRIHIERADWSRLTSRFRAIFRVGKQMVQDDEQASLATLLARRDQVRQSHAELPNQPNLPNRFETGNRQFSGLTNKDTDGSSEPENLHALRSDPSNQVSPKVPLQSQTEANHQVQSTASRLLDAKRRAKK